MNIIYISNWNQENPRLFPTFKKTFEEQRHTETNKWWEATHCFLEVQSGIQNYDELTLIELSRKGVPIFCFDSREWGTMKNEKWFPIDLNVDVYFIRNMNKAEEYSDNCYPFDWPYFQECNFEPTSKEELNSRPFDVSLFSVESPTRKRFIDAIIKDGRLKVNHKFLDHTQRLSYVEWITEHSKAKLYISCDGGGYTNERPNQLFSIAPMLKNKSNHLPAHPFSDGFNCIEINEEPTEGDISKVVDILSDQDWLYKIYTNGIIHTQKYHSAEVVSNYVLQIINEKERN